MFWLFGTGTTSTSFDSGSASSGVCLVLCCAHKCQQVPVTGVFSPPMNAHTVIAKGEYKRIGFGQVEKDCLTKKRSKRANSVSISHLETMDE